MNVRSKSLKIRNHFCTHSFEKIELSFKAFTTYLGDITAYIASTLQGYFLVVAVKSATYP